MIKAAHYQNKIVLIFGPAHALACCRFPKKSKFQDNFFFLKHLSSYVLLACFLSHLVFLYRYKASFIWSPSITFPKIGSLFFFLNVLSALRH